MARTKVVALLFGLFSNYAKGALRGISSWVALTGGWKCVLVNTLPTPSISLDPITVLKRQQPDGVIAAITEKEIAHALREMAIPTVDICDWHPQYRFPRLQPDDVAVGRMAAQHLLECHLIHFGFYGDFRVTWCRRRFKGFSQVLREAGFSCARFDAAQYASRDWIAACWSSSTAELQTWITRLPKPVGILGASDQRGLHLLDACSERNIHVPEDVAILGVDNDTLLCELAQPPLSSVATDTERLGYEAAALLDGLMRGAAAPCQTILIANRGVVTRQSTDMLAVGDPSVAAALRFIRDSHGKGISVGHVLARIPESRRTLERRFRQWLNRGIQEEIRRVRLERAAQLLRDTDLPLKALATRAGFSSATRLSKAFHRVFDRPPRAYRMAFRITKMD